MASGDEAQPKTTLSHLPFSVVSILFCCASQGSVQICITFSEENTGFCRKPTGQVV